MTLHSWARCADSGVNRADHWLSAAQLVAGLGQFGVHNIFVSTTPWGIHTATSVFDGALWSLAYEMLCYVISASWP